MAAILKIQNGGHDELGRSVSYQKLNTIDTSSTWKKFGAFVQPVSIDLLSSLTKSVNRSFKAKS